MGNYQNPHHIHIIADSETWIEGNAVAQLETTAKLPHMLRVAGMPDLHAGRGYPVGAAFFSEHHFYPALIGNDIGCGMAFWQTDLSAAKLKPAKLAKQLGNIDTPLSQDEQEALLEESASDYPFSDDLAVGTIGGGNHFAELQTVETVYRADLLPAAFDSNRLQLLVHSGSRGLGQQILQRHIEAYGHRGLAEGSEAAADYLAEHQAALEFARLNRRLIAARMLDRWRTEGDCLLDVHHNFLEQARHDQIARAPFAV